MYRQFQFIIFLVFALCSSISMAESTQKHDTTLPVEITADELEVLQKDQKAIFSGNVEAKQGNLDLKSDKMTVYYKQKGGASSENENSVSKVETAGNVFLKTPKESARGDNGVFDVDQSTVILSGKVELSSGKNVVKGEKLVYNIKTGQSRLSSSGSDSEVGSPNITKKKERVKGIFVPQGR